MLVLPFCVLLGDEVSRYDTTNSTEFLMDSSYEPIQMFSNDCYENQE